MLSGLSLQVEVNTDYIPGQLEADYTRERPGKALETLVPPGKAPDQFNDSLAIKFQNVSTSMCYRNISTTRQNPQTCLVKKKKKKK